VERREEIIEAAFDAFSETGLDGTSTETIARRVGISQPYLFRLFGTKKELFVAAVERCLEQACIPIQSGTGWTAVDFRPPGSIFAIAHGYYFLPGIQHFIAIVPVAQPYRST